MGLFAKPSKTNVKAALRGLDAGAVCAVLEQFPIGSALHYYPEFNKALQLETVILGYQINKHDVYSARDVVCENHAAEARVLLRDTGRPLRVSRLGIIIPEQNRGVGHLNYAQREALERSGDSADGNHLTLLGAVSRGVRPVLQTTVRKHQRINAGPFTDTPVVVLDVHVDSLQQIDQRAHERLQLQVPARIELGKGMSLEGTLADIAERSVRLRTAAGWPIDIVTGWTLSVSVRLPGAERDTVLGGEVFRVDYNDLVLKLTEIERDGLRRRIGGIDVLEIKSRLLQLPVSDS